MHFLAEPQEESYTLGHFLWAIKKLICNKDMYPQDS